MRAKLAAEIAAARKRGWVSVGTGLRIAITVFVAATLAFGASITVLAFSNQAAHNRDAVTRAQILHESCRVQAQMFKELRTEIRQGQSLLKDFPAFDTPRVRAQTHQRLVRVSNRNLPVFCPERKDPDTIYRLPAKPRPKRKAVSRPPRGSSQRVPGRVVQVRPLVPSPQSPVRTPQNGSGPPTTVPPPGLPGPVAIPPAPQTPTTPSPGPPQTCVDVPVLGHFCV